MFISHLKNTFTLVLLVFYLYREFPRYTRYSLDTKNTKKILGLSLNTKELRMLRRKIGPVSVTYGK